MRVLLVGGSPEPSSPALVAGLAARADAVLAVDRGADACRAAGVMPNAFCGDADTVSADTFEWVRSGLDDSLVRLFPPAKDYTDLTHAFECARVLATEACASLEPTLTCASAGRMDHALVVFGVLSANAELAPRLVEDAFECRILSPKGQPDWRLGPGAVGRRFSLVALADGTVVSERRLRWELDHEPMYALKDRGISNEVDRADAVVTCHEGVAAAFLVS